MKRGPLIVVLTLACFPTVPELDDTGTTESGTASTAGPGPSSNSVSTASASTASSASVTGAGTSTGEQSTSTGTTGSAGTGTGTDTDDCQVVEVLGRQCCPWYDVPVDGFFAVGDTRVLTVDFDDFPGDAGARVELCMTLTSDNAVSSRIMTIAEQWLGFGPCGGIPLPPPGPYAGCDDYLKPAGGAIEISIDNTNCCPGGCQSGTMDDLVLHFGCVPEE